MSGPFDAVRIVRGKPLPEELAAVVAILGALTAAGGDAVTAAPPPAAPWTRPTGCPPAPAWSTRRPPAWRTA
ncbi:acyl-CoA carboxylase epsilon subunit [Streptomyces sp. 7N604]|uniref:acyl-CoA carboxylase epsilon subunit n=1 Tax=Streptomyces sp. 7N604 TaxID=3457415 RepID=UPI003FD5F222